MIKAFFESIYDFLFGCHHARLTRPFTLEQQSYKVCLDCGRELHYSVDAMRLMTIREVRRAQALNRSSLVIPINATERAAKAELSGSNAAA